LGKEKALKIKHLLGYDGAVTASIGRQPNNGAAVEFLRHASPGIAGG
jgi:hypothetical protein